MASPTSRPTWLVVTPARQLPGTEKERALPFSAGHGVSQTGGRRKSFDRSACPAKSRSTASPLTNGDANPSPSCFRPFLKARSAMQASSAARARSGSWPGFCMIERITARILTAPFESNASPAAAGRARCAASIMTRQAANGIRCTAAVSAAMWDSMSTATAPVVRKRCDFSAGVGTMVSAPTISASTAPGSRSESSCVHFESVAIARSRYLTVDAMTQSPATRSGLSPPEIPKLMMPETPG